MGTSADLAVRHRGRTFFQHTSYDGHEHNVLSQMAGTWVAAGIEALRARLDQEPEETGPIDEDLFIDRRGMGNAYLAACQARGREPINLDYAMGYEYGNPDFSHGGIIPLLAPTIAWSEGFCDRIEETSFILDLDREVLLVPNWNNTIEEGSYDNGTLDVLWSVPWATIRDLDPSALMQALDKAEYDYDLPQDQRQAMIGALLTQLVEATTPPDLADDFYIGPRFQNQEEFQPSMHFLRGAPEHAAYQQAAIDFLRDQATNLPVFGEPNTLLMEMRDGEAVLVVDLRKGDSAAAQNLVAEAFDSLSRATGMVSEMQSDGHSKSVGVYRSAFSSGFGSQEGQHAWDHDLVSEHATAVGMEDRKSEQIEKAIKNKDENALELALVRAIIGFDDERWHRIEGLLTATPADAEFMPSVVATAVEACRHFERAVPGSTLTRFSRLSDGHRSAFLEALAPVDRYMFTQLLAEPVRKTGGPKF